MRTIDQMVQQEILCCMSSMVSTLASGYGAAGFGAKEVRDLSDFLEQAMELASPVPDYEEALIQGGAEPFTDKHGVACWRDMKDGATWAGDAQSTCEAWGVDPYDREVFEHWAVTDWFADRLIEQGEKVDKDFAGLCVWARTTTGQGIASDGVVQRIYEAVMK